MWLQRQGVELGKAINDLQHCIESNYMNMKNENTLVVLEVHEKQKRKYLVPFERFHFYSKMQMAQTNKEE